MNELPYLNLIKTSPIPFRIEKIVHKNNYNPELLHRHKYHEIFLFEKGSGYHLIDFEKKNIEDRSIHVLLPGQVHQLARGGNANGYVIMFEADFFHMNPENKDFINSLTYLFNQAEHTSATLKEETFIDLISILDIMQKEYESPEGFKVQILQSYLNIVIYKVKQLLEKQPHAELHQEKSDLKLFYEFKQMVEEKFVSHMSVADYCISLKTTYKHLSKSTMQYMGKNPAQIIQDRLCLEAKRLLAHTRYSIKEIAYNLGYEDPSHFGKLIKKSCGLSPAALKEELGKIYHS